MFDMKKNFLTSKKLEEEGIEVALGDGATITVARNNNTLAKEVFARESRPYKQILRTETPAAQEVLRTISLKVMAEAVLKNWTGIFEDGKEVKFSKENALDYLTKYPEFANIVAEISNNAAAFRDEEVEDDSKNSKPSLSGN